MSDLHSKILLQVNQKRLVPIIGEDMFVHRKADGTEESLQEFIVDSYLSNHEVKDMDNDIRQRAVNEGYHGMSLLFNHSKYRNYSEERTDFNFAIESIVYGEIENIHLKDDVRSLLLTGKRLGLFPLIITTSPFDIIERDLGYEIQNPFVPGQDPKCARNSMYFLAGNQNKEPIKDPCVYHLFGCAADMTSVWASNEYIMTNFLHELHTTPDDFPLKKQVAGKTLLVMGCSLPNWMFRFLLYPLNKENGFWLEEGRPETDENNQEIDSLGKIQLDEYLQDLNYNKGSLEEVVNSLRKDLERLAPEGPSKSESYDFFISHDAKDKEFAQIIVSKLRKDGCSVWVDYENEGNLVGDDWGKIKYALSHSRHMIPLITGRYLRRFSAFFSNPQNAQADSMECISLVLMECVKPALLAGSLEPRLNDSFIIPIMKNGDVIRGSITVTNAYVQDQIKSGNVPSQLSLHRFIYYPEGSDTTGGNNYLDQDWKKLGEEGETLSEKGIEINDLMNISDELKKAL